MDFIVLVIYKTMRCFVRRCSSPYLLAVIGFSAIFYYLVQEIERRKSQRFEWMVDVFFSLRERLSPTINYYFIQWWFVGAFVLLLVQGKSHPLDIFFRGLLMFQFIYGILKPPPWPDDSLEKMEHLIPAEATIHLSFKNNWCTTTTRISKSTVSITTMIWIIWYHEVNIWKHVRDAMAFHCVIWRLINAVPGWHTYRIRVRPILKKENNKFQNLLACKAYLGRKQC
ncbi:hypothetical protein EUTSA_v10019475mg [Eutrema salsugineum]|uniref:Uncharacterized protein n=1 Tax=Eutrema salsugineum TaxID=72664 RepID=V4JTW5_EUTSA|nr:hypothetical protein EUTSA_v10019475mg [Eutrema salsugineum]